MYIFRSLLVFQFQPHTNNHTTDTTTAIYNKRWTVKLWVKKGFPTWWKQQLRWRRFLFVREHRPFLRSKEEGRLLSNRPSERSTLTYQLVKVACWTSHQQEVNLLLLANQVRKHSPNSCNRYWTIKMFRQMSSRGCQTVARLWFYAPTFSWKRYYRNTWHKTRIAALQFHQLRFLPNIPPLRASSIDGTFDDVQCGCAHGRICFVLCSRHTLSLYQFNRRLLYQQGFSSSDSWSGNGCIPSWPVLPRSTGIMSPNVLSTITEQC